MYGGTRVGFPDQLQRLKPFQSESFFWNPDTGGAPPPVYDPAEMGWAGYYPNQHWVLSKAAALNPLPNFASIWGTLPGAAAPDLSWQGVWPTQIRRVIRVQGESPDNSAIWASLSAAPYDPAGMQWKALWPDGLRAKTTALGPLPDYSPIWATLITPYNPAGLEWKGLWPDQLWAKRNAALLPLPDFGGVWGAIPPPALVDLSWLPAFPDIIWAAGPRQQGWQGAEAALRKGLTAASSFRVWFALDSPLGE